MINVIDEYADPSLYDAEYGKNESDFPLFLNLIDQGEVLDLACGTGRLTIPLARKGLVVTGLDAHKKMIERAQDKAQGLDIHWIQGDISNFVIHQTFDLILMAGNSFQALLSEDDQARMLSCVKKHLKPSGVFAFDTRNRQMEDFISTEEFAFWHNFQDASGEEVKVYGKQSCHKELVTYTTKRVWETKETLSEITLRFTGYDDLMELLDQQGFVITDVYGDCQKGAFLPDSPSIVMICRSC